MEDAPAQAERILVGIEERYWEGRHRRDQHFVRPNDYCLNGVLNAWARSKAQDLSMHAE